MKVSPTETGYQIDLEADEEVENLRQDGSKEFSVAVDDDDIRILIGVLANLAKLRGHYHLQPIPDEYGVEVAYDLTKVSDTPVIASEEIVRRALTKKVKAYAEVAAEREADRIADQMIETPETPITPAPTLDLIAGGEARDPDVLFAADTPPRELPPSADKAIAS